MATRRQQPSKSTAADDGDTNLQDSTTPLSSAPGASDTAPEVPISTIIKLAVFTLAMFAGPLAAYFLSVHTVFAGNPTYAGALAAVVANLVLVAFIIVAVREDQSDRRDESHRMAGPEKARKAE